MVKRYIEHTNLKENNWLRYRKEKRKREKREKNKKTIKQAIMS